MISASEMASIQNDVASVALSLPCTIQRNTSTPDGIGTSTPAWSTISPNGLLAGMNQPTAGMLQNYDYLIGSLSAWMVRLPVGTNIQEQDRLIISGKTLTVQVVLQPKSYQALLTCLAAEVQ